MENCFEGLIGIKGLCGVQTPPSSQLYIQDLPLIDLVVADAILGGTDKDGLEYIHTKLNYAYNLVRSESRAMIAPMFKAKSVLENNTLGYYQPEMSALPAAAVYRGVKIRIQERPFLNFKLNSVAMYSSNFTGNLPIVVFDLNTGAQIDTFNIAVTAGEINYIPVNQSYFTNRGNFEIYIAYDATLIDSFLVSPSLPSYGCFSCNRGQFGYNGRYIIYDGAEASLSGPTLSGLNYTGFTGGLSVQYTVECSMDAWLCSMKDRLAFAVLHRFGVVMCEEIMAGSKRVNSITTIDVSKAEYLHPIMYERYKTALDSTLLNIKAPNDICFTCNSAVRSVVRIP